MGTTGMPRYGLREAFGALGADRHEIGTPFSEGAAWAGEGITEEAPDGYLKLNIVIGDWHSARHTNGAAMDPGRQLVAIRTGNRRPDGRRRNHEFLIKRPHAVNPKSGHGERQHKHRWKRHDTRWIPVL